MYNSYTEEEYKALMKYFRYSTEAQEVLFHIIPKHDGLNDENMRNHVYQGWHQLFKLIYETPLSDVPLFMDVSDMHDIICQWRFQINK